MTRRYPERASPDATTLKQQGGNDLSDKMPEFQAPSISAEQDTAYQKTMSLSYQHRETAASPVGCSSSLKVPCPFSRVIPAEAISIYVPGLKSRVGRIWNK